MKRRCAPTVVLALLLTSRIAVAASTDLETGELAQIVDAEGHSTTLGYDLRGLRTSLDNPDDGLIEDRFDLMGNHVALIEPNHRGLAKT